MAGALVFGVIVRTSDTTVNTFHGIKLKEQFQGLVSIIKAIFPLNLSTKLSLVLASILLPSYQFGLLFHD
jgi:hypothetical protein